MNKFINYLTNIEYASKSEEKKFLWNIKGILKNRSNEVWKFDTRPISEHGNEVGKKGRLDSKADKMVFYLNNKYILVDVKEMHAYLKKHKLKKIYLDHIVKELEWNIII